MDQDIKKLKKLVRFMRETGVLELKQPNLELKLAPGALFPEGKRPPSVAPQADEQSEQPYTEEEILMWSSAGPNLEETH